MSAWRRKAIETFPDLRRELESPETTIYTLFFELLDRCKHRGDSVPEEERARIFAFAEWCSDQPARDLWNAAAVTFYEHMGDTQATRDQMKKYVKPITYWTIRTLLVGRIESAGLQELDNAFESKIGKKGRR
jgi:hypothetical protein